MLSPYLKRAQLLISQKRHDDATKEIGKALAENPEDPFAIAMLSDCYLEADKREEALELAKQAVSIAPFMSFFYHNLARTQFFNKQIDECKTSIEEGLKLSPNDADFFLLLAQVEFYLENWETTLEAANTGLSLEPENVNLINIRTQALVKLDRKSEAVSSIDFALHRDPENAHSHANKGWVAIEQGDHQTALKHFKESLRLDPINDYAKTGLKEAIKSQNIVYRYILQYFLWMNRLQEKSRWGVVIGIYLIYQIVIRISEYYPSVALIMSPLVGIYILMAFSSWLAMPISNAFLRFHSLGKLALEKDEILASNITIGLLGSSIISFVLFFALGNKIAIENFDLMVSEGGEGLLITGLALFFMLIPVSALFKTTPRSKYRKQLGIGVGILSLFGILSILMQTNICLSAFFYGILIFSIVSNYVLTKNAKAF